jgi:hypothetical protein
MPIELMNQDVRVNPDVEPLEIDAEALVRDFSKRALPHDPAIDEIVEPVLLQVPPCAVCLDPTPQEGHGDLPGLPLRQRQPRQILQPVWHPSRQALCGMR